MRQQPPSVPFLQTSKGSTKRLLGVIGFLGLTLSLLLFWLVKAEVERFVIQKLEQPVSHTIYRLQKAINRDQYLLEAIAGMQAIAPSLSETSIQKFLTSSNRDQSLVSFVFLLKKEGDALGKPELILSMDSPKTPALDLGNFAKINAMALRALETGTSFSTVYVSKESPDKTEQDTLWLVSVRPVQNKQFGPALIAGFTPLRNLLGDLVALYAKGDLSRLTLSEVKGGKSSVFLRLDRMDKPFSILSPNVSQDRVFLEDHSWLIDYSNAPSQQTQLIILFPYALLACCLVLTWFLVMYLRASRARAAEVGALVVSLHRANEELNRKITDESRMARALRESEQKYREIFENAGIGICQIAPSGEWLNANKTMAQIMGHDNPQELLFSQPDLHGGLFMDTSQRRDWFMQLESSSRKEYEAALYDKNRNIVWVNISGHAVRDTEGNLLYFECTMYDVTERRRAELALIRAKEEADFANRSKSEFLANMSHELRTPLNAIIGFGEILKDQLFGPMGQPQYVEYARDIHDSGQLLLSLINDILDMSKIEAGKRELADADLDIEAIATSVVRLVAARAKAGKVKLHAEVSHDLPHLRAEERAMKQILTNLLTNAIKFTPEGGNVTLWAGLIENGSMKICVSDTGIGIAQEDINVALAPFGQIESALSRKNQGTGLGLPLTRSLVELHGGMFKLESEIGKGTTVTAIFPPERVVQL